MENIQIKKFVIDNFKEDTENELKETIDDTVKEGLEETLPGLGVFMEIIWTNSSDELKKELVAILKAHLD